MQIIPGPPIFHARGPRLARVVVRLKYSRRPAFELRSSRELTAAEAEQMKQRWLAEHSRRAR